MKRIMIAFISILLVFTCTAQSSAEKKVSDAVEQLKTAMLDGNKSELEKLISDNLSYGHSGGHIDDKKEFIDKLTSGRSDFVTMDLTDQSITIFGKTAIVRHTLTAKTNDGGKAGDVHLLVLLVWQKQHGHWILIARQAVKPS